MTRPRIIFVPGLNPKPPPELYLPQLRRVLLAGLQRSRPLAGDWFAGHAETLELVAWTYLFYGAHRDITIDIPGIERLLRQPQPSDEDLRELGSWSRRFRRWTHMLGDFVPLLGRQLAQPATKLLMHEASRYLKNRDGKGSMVRAVLREALERAWAADERVLLIGHSLGSVIAYDTLWELSRAGAPGEVALLITLGSPLGTHFVQRSLQGADEHGAARYPANIRRWRNFTARGDTTALRRRLRPFFAEMIELGLVESIEDRIDFDNYFRGATGLNAHEAYGYLVQPLIGEAIGAWLEQTIRP